MPTHNMTIFKSLA